MQQIKIPIRQHNSLASASPLLHAAAKLLPLKNLALAHFCRFPNAASDH
jgi:hypothetical protein